MCVCVWGGGGGGGVVARGREFRFDWYINLKTEHIFLLKNLRNTAFLRTNAKDSPLKNKALLLKYVRNLFTRVTLGSPPRHTECDVA